MLIMINKYEKITVVGLYLDEKDKKNRLSGIKQL
jgi:hypothetical protein